jgi:hypothetical protein
VNLPSGTYYVAGLKYNTTGNAVVRGAGPKSTYVYFDGSASGCMLESAICMQSSSPTQPASSNVLPPSGSQQCRWTGTNGTVGTYTQGATSVILNSCGGAPPVGIIILDQQNDLADTGGQYVCDGFSNATCNLNGASNAQGRQIGGYTYSEQVVTYATAVSGSGAGPYTVTINPPVYFNNFRSSQTPGAWWGGTVSNLGLEDLTVDWTNTASSTHIGINMWECYHCWVKNVRSLYGRTNHVNIEQSSGNVIRDSYFYQSQAHGTQSYGIEPNEASDGLIENNIFQQLTSPIVPGQMSGYVIGYNLSIDSQGTNYMQDNYDSHSAGSGFNLWEGNNILGAFNDDTWGSSGLSTLFRNRILGWESGYSQQTNAILLSSFSRGYNLIGNIIGQSGYHTTYEAYPPNTYSQGQCNVSEYQIGFSGGNPCTKDSNIPNDTLVRDTMMRWGNEDAALGAPRWNTTEAQPSGVPFIKTNTLADPSSHVLASSYYLSSKPAWWRASKSWPAIGPDVTTGNVGRCSGGTYSGVQCTATSQCGGGNACTSTHSTEVSIPALDCYLNVMAGPADGSGSVLSFDANSCYTGQGGGPPPPQSLNSVVH